MPALVPRSPPLRAVIATQIRNQCADIVLRWRERISARVAIGSNDVFPTRGLLNHVALPLDGMRLDSTELRG